MRPVYKSTGAFAARQAFGNAYIEGMDYVGLSGLLGEIRAEAIRRADKVSPDADPQDYELEAAHHVARLYRAPR